MVLTVLVELLAHRIEPLLALRTLDESVEIRLSPGQAAQTCAAVVGRSLLG